MANLGGQKIVEEEGRRWFLMAVKRRNASVRVVHLPPILGLAELGTKGFVAFRCVFKWICRIHVRCPVETIVGVLNESRSECFSIGNCSC